MDKSTKNNRLGFDSQIWIFCGDRTNTHIGFRVDEN